MSVTERDALHSVERACGLDLESRTLRTEIVSRLGRVIPHDAYCFATTDPWTLLLTDEVSGGIPPGGGSVATHNEYLVDDVDKFADLARSQRSVGMLNHSTGGEPERSHRFRTVLPIIDAQDEMRIVFLADRQCWGALSLFRGHNRPCFTPHDANLAEAISRSVAVALRRAAGRPGTSLGATPGNPGVLMLDHRGGITASNEAAKQWLDELSPHQMALHEVASASRAGHGAKSYLRVRSRTGQWLSLWGSAMDGGADDDSVSVVIQPAPTSDIARLLALVYALSPREQQMLQCVIAGASTPAIAAELQVSAHTVQSHLKSLFAKVGVSSRGQLVSQVVGEIYGL
ncbi:DNA-binding CsgD family transcriptional regulator [Nocardia transvalensis]|uniref:DNA-binding CsgD family transcriptional regulator n=1 Tax=Nocardia transvalensis TaxID=37333 RepID=A0A7W9PKD0_9NOCA|nr:LuxR C-terminal-related transcriptional regulator [Nocardia transvalensis]MBB5917631.1 DNA-binding CsgD family transcriptional regulator [Nocardia transvalensis]